MVSSLNKVFNYWWDSRSENGPSFILAEKNERRSVWTNGQQEKKCFHVSLILSLMRDTSRKEPAESICRIAYVFPEVQNTNYVQELEETCWTKRFPALAMWCHKIIYLPWRSLMVGKWCKSWILINKSFPWTMRSLRPRASQPNWMRLARFRCPGSRWSIHLRNHWAPKAKDEI